MGSQNGSNGSTLTALGNETDLKTDLNGSKRI